MKNLNIVQPVLKKGDACMIDFNMIHQSGQNTSNHFRFTAIGRYHYTATSDFVPFRNNPVFTDLT